MDLTQHIAGASPPNNPDHDVAFTEAALTHSLTLSGLLQSIWRHRLIFSVLGLSTLGIALAIILSLQSRYDSVALLIVDPRQMNIANFRAVQNEPTMSDLNFVRSQMQILTSDEFARRVVTDMKLQDDAALAAAPTFPERLLSLVPERLLPSALRPTVHRPPTAGANSIEAAVARYKDQFSAFSDGKSFIIAASFNAADPVFAQRVLARHLALFQEAQVAAKGSLIVQAEKWLSEELVTLHSKLLTSEARQQKFRRTNQLIRAGGETIPARQLAAITNQLSDARSDLMRKEARSRELSSVAKGGLTADTATLSSGLVQRLRERESQAAQRVAQLEHSFGPAYPSVISERRGLADIQSRIALEIQRLAASATSDAAIARANVDDLKLQLEVANKKLGTTSDDELTAAQLERDIEVDRHLYDDLLLRSKQVSMQGQLQDADTRIVSAATLPLRPSFPRKGMLIAISMMAAAVIGGVAAFMVDLFSARKAATLEEIAAVCGAAGLAVIPWLSASERRRVAPPKAGTYLAATLQRLANSIAFRCVNRSPRVTVFMSAFPGEGKTVLATLYARAMASGGKHVLLVDADLRRCGLTKSIAAGAGRGLAECLTGLPLKECVFHDRVAGVDILAMGGVHGDPGMLLTADRIFNFLAAAKNDYEAIVIDTPPVMVVDDALQLIAQADATVLVARWNRTPLEAIRKVLERVALTSGNVVGVAITAADMRKYRSGPDTPASRARSKSYYLANS